MYIVINFVLFNVKIEMIVIRDSFLVCFFKIFFSSFILYNVACVQSLHFIPLHFVLVVVVVVHLTLLTLFNYLYLNSIMSIICILIMLNDVTSFYNHIPIYTLIFCNKNRIIMIIMIIENNINDCFLFNVFISNENRVESRY